MKKILLLCVVFTGLGTHAQQNWCIPVVDAADSGGSGILGVELDGTPNLHRSSLTGEGFLFTGMSTTLARGMFYTLMVDKHSGTVCPDNSIRVYIDFDQDLSFDGPGEVVAAMNYAGEGPDVFTVFVPMYALEGPTRMRVVEKMVPSCGYGPIDPCGLDAVAGVHRGEIEDYTIVISGQVGLPELTDADMPSLVVNDHTIELVSERQDAHPYAITITDLTGREVLAADLGSLTPGRRPIGRIDRRGIYIAHVRSGSQECTNRIWVP